MTERVIMAGWGGQGMMTLGKLVAWIVLEQGREVTYFPSYGAEVRGGAAHCHVVFSDEPIHSPVVEHADTLILMNQPSYDRFRERLKPDGMVLLNSSMVGEDAPGPGQTSLRVPATEAADGLGDVRIANTLMLGVYNHVRRFAPHDSVLDALRKALSSKGEAVVDVNRKAYERGLSLAASLAGD
jgi:2-oxoglutarate ferredoxin oxidoreductase subunit gamma